MASRKAPSTQESDASEPTKYENPWKLLAVFGTLLAIAIIYGFLT